MSVANAARRVSVEGSRWSGVLPSLIMFIVGLAVRLPGVLFNGMHDLDQFIFQWGSAVRYLGLGAGFQDNYGPLSFALYGIDTALAEQIPRYWWLPYKLMEISLEIAVLIALYRLLPAKRKHLALLLYWLNPWFIVNGAWHGFWDGAYLLFALLAVIFAGRAQQPKTAWGWVGALLMISAMFKPQGLIYFVLPISVYLLLEFVQNRRLPLIGFGMGLLIPLAVTTVVLVITGGGVLAIPRNYLSAATVMPYLCNNCINIWRTISAILQTLLGQTGPVYSLQLPKVIYLSLHLFALCATLILLGLFFLRIPMSPDADATGPAKIQLKGWIRIIGLGVVALAGLELLLSSGTEHGKWLIGGHSIGYVPIVLAIAVVGGITFVAAPLISNLLNKTQQFAASVLQRLSSKIIQHSHTPYIGVYLVITFTSLVIPQIGTKAHINHTYAGLVLLIPLVIANRRVMWLWLTMIGIHLYSNVAAYQLGRSMVLPETHLDYPTAQPLISQIQAVLAAQPIDPVSQFQINANQFLAGLLPQEPVITILSAVQFVCVIIIVREMYTIVTRPDESSVLMLP